MLFRISTGDTSSIKRFSVCVSHSHLISFVVYFADKLDGIRPMKRRRAESPPFPLSDDDDPYDEREEDMRIGKKRVSGLG